MDKAQLERMSVGEYFHNDEEWRIESKTYFNTVVCICTRAGGRYKLGQKIEWRTTVASHYKKGRHPNCENPNSLLSEFVIKHQTVDVYYGGELAIPQANEYTVRNLLVAVKKGGEFNREKIQIMEVFNGETSIHTVNENFKITPKFRSNFFSLSYDLVFELII